MVQAVEADVLIALGPGGVSQNIPLARANAPDARLWEVEIWPRNGVLYSPQSYSPANYACFQALVDVDSPITQRLVGGENVSSARNWLIIGPRGARLTVFGKSVTVQIAVASGAPGVVAAAPALMIAARIEPIAAPMPARQAVLGMSRGTLGGYGQTYQLPAFSTEFRLYGGNGPQSTFALVDGTLTGPASNVLIDPWTSGRYEQMCGIAGEWTPLHPFAAGISVDGGTMVETR